MPSRIISFYVELDYNFDGTFTDESDKVISFNVERSLSGVSNPFLSSNGKVDRAVINLKNTDSRFSSKITTGALYSDIANGKIFHVPIRVGVNTGGSDYRIFTGICQIPNEVNGTPNQPRIISLTAFSNEEKHLNTLTSLSIAKGKEWFDSNPDESEVIEYLLDEIGETGYTLDSGVYNLLPFYNQRSIMQVLWDVAKSAGGFLFTNRLGKFIYKNSTSFVGQASLEIFDRENFSLVDMYYPDINIAKKVNVSGESVTVNSSTNLFVASGTYTIPPNENLEIEIELNDPAYELLSITYDAKTFSGIDISADISLTRLDTVETLFLNFLSTSDAYCIISNLTVVGKGYTFTPFKVTKTSTDSFWTDRSLSDLTTNIRGTFLNSEGTANAIAELVLNAQQLPTSVFKVRDLVYDSALELLDIITIFDNQISSSAVDIILTKLEYGYSAESGARVNVEGIETTNLYPYLDTSPGYFILGTNKLGSSDALKARLFY